MYYNCTTKLCLGKHEIIFVRKPKSDHKYTSNISPEAHRLRKPQPFRRKVSQGTKYTSVEDSHKIGGALQLWDTLVRVEETLACVAVGITRSVV